MQAKPKTNPPRTGDTEGAGSAIRTEAKTPSPPTRAAAPQPRPGAPNGWRRGHVLRTLWPAEAGTRRWLDRYGAALVCVRHREDPAGLRRVVTVELLVGEVRSRRRVRRLNKTATYPLRVAPGAGSLRQLLRAHGARHDPYRGLWHARGQLIEALGLLDWIILPAVRQHCK